MVRTLLSPKGPGSISGQGTKIPQAATCGQKKKKISDFGTSLLIQWLRLCASTAGVQVPSLVRELRQCMPHSEAKNKMLGL